MRVLTLLSLLLLAGCGDAPPPPAVHARVVLAHVVNAADMRLAAEYSGEVKPRQELPLGFRVPGKLTQRLVEVGDHVSAGQVLARLDPEDLEQSRRAAEAQLAAAEAELRFAQAEMNRYQGLFQERFVSRAALEGKETALEAAREKVGATRAQRAIAGNQATYAVLRSDAAGVVSAVLAEAGQVLAAGTPVLKLARDGEKEVLIAVPENRVTELDRAGEVTVTLWAAPDRTYRGRVREIAPQADAVTRTYAARVSLLDADATVRLGQTARVILKVRETTAGALLPAGAVFQKGREPAVWVIGADARVRLRPVKVEAWREDGVAISAGLAAGERIVAAGAYKLTEGEAVQVEREGRL